MSERDTRPGWMKRKQARISNARLARFGLRPDRLSLDEWWEQITTTAAELQLEPGPWTDWQPWPINPATTEDDPL